MPARKQPPLLQAICVDVLIDWALQCCYKRSAEDSLSKLRDTITFVKEEICNRMPWHMVADFCNKFLRHFLCGTNEVRDESHLKAGLEIIMDIEINGLQGDGSFMTYLEACDVSRLYALELLDLSHCYSRCVATELDKFYLGDLKTFVYCGGCTDQDLRIIGRNCPKLEVVKLWSSQKVTDAGLIALERCSELRLMEVEGCSVSMVGIKHLLGLHSKLAPFDYRNEYNWYIEGNKILCRNYSSEPSLSMSSLSIYSKHVTVDLLDAIGEKFPNLKRIVFNESYIEFNLVELRRLETLTGLAISYTEMRYLHETFSDEDAILRLWKELREYLTIVGAKITNLTLLLYYEGFVWTQEHLNFIHEACPNLEYFEFDNESHDLIIPSFRKLETLVLCLPMYEQLGYKNSDNVELKFSVLANLKTLSFRYFTVTVDILKSIMFDSYNFPKLKEIVVCSMWPLDHLHLQEIAKTNNLDLRIESRS